MKSFTLSNTIKPKIEKNQFLEAINESINIEIKGDPNKFLNVQIQGKDELVKELENFFKEQRKIIKQNTLNKLKKEHYHVLDLNKLGKQIEMLSEYDNSASSFENVPSPADIFSSEDYEEVKTISPIIKAIKIISLNNVPDEYKEFLNPLDIQKFFSQGFVNIAYSSDNWSIDFTFTIDDTFVNLVKENKFFIMKFIQGTLKLIGTEHLQLSSKLTSLLK